MNILLINPPFLSEKGKFSREQRSPAVTKSGTFYYPMWLAFATGVLEQNGHTCLLIDAPAEGCDFETIIRHKLGDFSPDLIVVDTSTPSIYNDVDIAGRLKQHFEDAYTVLVGNHPSALPEETLEIDPRVDGVLRREYEYPLLDLASAIESGGKRERLRDVGSLSFRDDGKIVHNELANPPNDLDSIPFVSEVYHRHLNYNDYFYAHSKYPIVTIISGRGCPHHCIYCVYPQVFSGRKVRVRSVKNVVDEIEYILTNFTGVKEIMFEDDTFTLNKKRCFEFAEEVHKRGLKFQWSANARADVDLETMQALKKSGVRLFCVGIESGVQDILNNMKKGLTTERIRQFFKDAKRGGILVHGCFLLGNPGETKQTLDKTLSFAKELNPDTAQFFPIMVYPGTEAYEWAAANDYLTTRNHSEWLTEDGLHNCIVSRPGLSNRELVDFCDRARKEFYLRPKYILSKGLEGLRDPYEFKRLAKGALQLSRHIFKRTERSGEC